MRQQNDPVVKIVLAFVGIVFLLMIQPWKHWDAITSAPERFWQGVLYHLSAFWQGMTTHGLAASIVASLFMVPIGLLIGWLNGRRLARIEVRRAEARAVAAERQAADDRQKRIDAEKQAAAAQKLAQQALADKAAAERRALGLQTQFDSAVYLADDRGKQLREIREKKRAGKGQSPKKRGAKD